MKNLLKGFAAGLFLFVVCIIGLLCSTGVILSVAAGLAFVLACYGVYAEKRAKNATNETTKNYRQMNT
jgi:uncharacterized membrane protein